MPKKDDIRSAALQLLVEKGVHNTPMSAIAKAAGTGMGTIYNHFPKKELLINDIYIRIKEKEEAVFLEVDTSKPTKTQFENYMIVLIDFFINNPLYFKFLQQMEASPIISQKNKIQGSKSVEMVAKLVKNGQADRIIKDINMEELLMFIGGAISAYLKWYFIKTDKKETSLKNHLQMVWDAIKA